MPIAYRIDHEKKIVLARGYGAFTDVDVFGYQREVWSRPEVAGYDELVDMTDVTSVVAPSTDRIAELAAMSAGMDWHSSPSRFAIVAPGDLAFGLGRMLQSFREAQEGSTKRVGVFRTLQEALAFLTLEQAPKFPSLPGEDVAGDHLDLPASRGRGE
jgi:hypothetical protein